MVELLKIFGLILMIIGSGLIISVAPLVPASVVSVGPITVTGISEFNATRMISGVILFILGLVAYSGRVGLQTFKK